MLPEAANLPDHLIGDAWAFEWDFSDFPAGFLDTVTAASMEWRKDPDSETPDYSVTLDEGLTIEGASILVDETEMESFEDGSYAYKFVIWTPQKRTMARGEQRFFK